MSLLASFQDTRSTRGAVAAAVALHVVVLLGLVQYAQTGRIPNTGSIRADSDQPITMVFVGDAARPMAISTPTPAPTQPTVAPLPAHALPAVQAPLRLSANAPLAKEAVAEAASAAAQQAAPVATSASAANTAAREAALHTASYRAEDARLEGAAPLQAGKPDYAYNPQPDYPMVLREQGVGGVVWLRVWVDSDGHPGEIKLAKGSGYRLMDDAALRAVRQWRFVPAKRGEQSLASWVEFPIRFTLNG